MGERPAVAPGGRLRALAAVGLTLACGLAGAQLFVFLALPLPWLLGAIFGALLASLIPRFPAAKPARLAHPVRALLGLAIGSSFTLALLGEIGNYLVSLAAMVPLLLVMVMLGVTWYHRVTGFDRRTAYFSALPGGLLEMSLICADYGADTRRVVLAQSTRVLLIVYTVPFLVQHAGGVDLTGRAPIAAPLAEVTLHDTVVLVVAATVGWSLLRRLRVSGASIVGPMLAGIVVYTAGWATQRPPDELIKFAQWVLGTGVGCSFVGVTAREALRSVVHTLGYFVILMLCAGAAAYGVHAVTGLPLIATLLAFVPGGQAEMNVIALSAGVLVPYIALHHVLRMFLVMSVAPLLARCLIAEPGRGT